MIDETPRPIPMREPERDFERSVLQLAEQHGKEEGAILESYQRIAERSEGNEAVQFLVGLILEDEKRHHQVFEKMANEMRSFLWEMPIEPRLPAMGASSDPDLLAETKRLLAFEKRDAKELRRLRRHLRGGPKWSLDPLMVELMLLDTAKHVAILEHIKDRLTH